MTRRQDAAQLGTQALAESVRSVVERIREDLFGRAGPPFPGRERAEQVPRWLAEEADRTKDIEDAVGELAAFRMSYLRRFGSVPPGWGPTASVPDEGVLHLRAGYRQSDLDVFALAGRLGRLRVGVREVQRITGWNETDVLLHILSGDIPRSTFRVRWTGRAGEIPYAEIVVWPWTLTGRDFAELHRALRDSVARGPWAEDMKPRTKGKRPTALDYRLADILAHTGRPPSEYGRNKVYWRDLARRWEAHTKERVRPDTLRRRSERLKKDHPDLLKGAEQLAAMRVRSIALRYVGPAPVFVDLPGAEEPRRVEPGETIEVPGDVAADLTRPERTHRFEHVGDKNAREGPAFLTTER